MAGDGFGDAVEAHGTHALLNGGGSNFSGGGSLSDEFLNLICDRQQFEHSKAATVSGASAFVTTGASIEADDFSRTTDR